MTRVPVIDTWSEDPSGKFIFWFIFPFSLSIYLFISPPYFGGKKVSSFMGTRGSIPTWEWKMILTSFGRSPGSAKRSGVSDSRCQVLCWIRIASTAELWRNNSLLNSTILFYSLLLLAVAVNVQFLHDPILPEISCHNYMTAFLPFWQQESDTPCIYLMLCLPDKRNFCRDILFPARLARNTCESWVGGERWETPSPGVSSEPLLQWRCPASPRTAPTSRDSPSAHF